MMQNSENDEGRRIRVKTHEGVSEKEVSADCNLPDYLPDVNRLLRISAKITECSHYLSGDMLEYDGKMFFSILYATGEGEMKNTGFGTDFSGNLTLSGMTGDCDIQFDQTVSTVSCRLQNPRKMTARAKLECRAVVTCSVSTEPTISGRLTAEETAALQFRRERMDSMTERCADVQSVPISEDIPLDTEMPTIEEIVAVELDPLLSDIRLADGKATYKGDVLAHILYRAIADGQDDMPPRYVSFSRKIPIAGDILSDEICEDGFPLASAKTDRLEFRPQANTSGENRTVELDFDYSVFLRVFCNDAAQTVSDLFSPDFASENTVVTLPYETAVCAKSFNFSTDGTAPREDREFDEIVATSATAKVDSVEKQNGKLVFNGTATVSVILTNRAGIYLSRQFSVPFKAQSEGCRVGDDFVIPASATVLSAESRLDEENMTANLEIFLSYVVLEKRERQMVRECKISKEMPAVHPAAASLTLCFPSQGETLWDIAKQYSITIEALSAENGISGEALPSVLVIPKHNDRSAKAG